MAIELCYKIYASEQYDALDKSLFTTNILWNLDKTEFLVEFKVKPKDEPSLLTRDEALAILSTSQWYSEFLLQ